MTDASAPARTGLPEDSSAPQASRGFYPGPVIRRNWLSLLLIASLVTAALITVLDFIPVRSTAVHQVRVLGSEGDTLFGGRGAARSPEEELQLLLAEFASPAVLGEAAESLGVPFDELDVVVTSPRQSLLIDIAVTSESPESAIAIANAIPEVVAEARRARLRSDAAGIVSELQARADAALEMAADLEEELAAADPSSSAAQIFEMGRRRDSLVALHSTLLAKAAEIELDTSVRSVGFEVAFQAATAARSFPPPLGQAIALAVLVGLLVGDGVITVRSLLRDRVYREHFDLSSGPRYLGRVESRNGRIDQEDLSFAAARVRALSSTRDPKSFLISMMPLDAAGELPWWVTSKLAGVLSKSGLDAVALRVSYRNGDGSDGDGGAHRVEFEEIEAEEWDQGAPALRSLRADAWGESALGAVYSSEMRDGIWHYRLLQDVLLVEASESGVDWWIETSMRPDLVVVLAVESRTTHTHYETTRRRLLESGLPAATLLLSVARPRRSKLLRAWARRVASSMDVRSSTQPAGD